MNRKREEGYSDKISDKIHTGHETCRMYNGVHYSDRYIHYISPFINALFAQLETNVLKQNFK